MVCGIARAFLDELTDEKARELCVCITQSMNEKLWDAKRVLAALVKENPNAEYAEYARHLVAGSVFSIDLPESQTGAVARITNRRRRPRH